MESISSNDLSIIVKGAIRMAQQDDKVVIEEESLIQKIIAAGQLDPAEFKNMDAPFEGNISDLCKKLSSDRAKKVFLLTLFAVANVDEDFNPAERELLENLSKELGVGKVKVNERTVSDCEKEVLKLISQN